MGQKRSTTAELRAEVRRFIVESYLANGQAEALGDDDDLLGVLDSLQVLRMIMHFEQTYRIKVDNRELTPENLGSIEKLSTFIGRKRA